jgi:DNA primase
MDSKTINMFPIREYLAGLNIYPANERGYYGMYHSPFREDRDASMKVDYSKNLWIDYGTNEGGTLIDLVMRMNNISFSDAVAELEKYDTTTVRQINSFSFHGNTVLPKQEPAIKIDKVQPIENPALISYLKERGIDIGIAKQYCSEVHYSVGDKSYFAVGFRNDTRGYELRNKYFKGSSSPKNITTINNGSDMVMLFEGFIDFLSYLSMKNNPTPRIDSAILNSVANLPKAIPFLQSHQTIHAFLDNDEGGKRTVDTLRSVCKEVIDQSNFYRNHKDLNECLCNRPAPKQAVIKKPGRGLKM